MYASFKTKNVHIFMYKYMWYIWTTFCGRYCHYRLGKRRTLKFGYKSALNCQALINLILCHLFLLTTKIPKYLFLNLAKQNCFDTRLLTHLSIEIKKLYRVSFLLFQTRLTFNLIILTDSIHLKQPTPTFHKHSLPNPRFQVRVE